MDPSFLQEKFAKQIRANRLKLGIMIVLLVAVVYGMVELSRKAPNTIPEEPPQGAKEESPKERPIGGLELGRGGRPPATITLTQEQLADKPYLTDPKTLDQITDKVTDLESGPFFYMLYKVSQATQEQLKREAKDVKWKALWDDPKAHRGEAIRVGGTIARIWTQPLGDSPLGLTQVYGYRLRSDDWQLGNKGEFLEVYSIEKLPGALVYDHVSTCGLFLKDIIIEPPGSIEAVTDPDLDAAVVIVRQFEPLTYLKAPEPPQPIVQDNRVEARALYWFLNKADKAPFGKLKEEATDKLTFLDYTRNPEAYLGKPVVLRGELRRLVRMPLPENILGLDTIYYGQILDSDRMMNTYYCLEVPEGVHLRDNVALYGYFFKRWTYVSEGDRDVTSPVIAGKRMLVLEYEKSYGTEILLGVIAILTAFALIYARSRERAREMAFDEARRERQLKRAPKNLNEVAHQRAAAGHIHHDEPKGPKAKEETPPGQPEAEPGQADDQPPEEKSEG